MNEVRNERNELTDPSGSRLRDSDGKWVTAGDWISFSFGIPPIYVKAKVYQEGKTLWYEIHSPKDVMPKTGKLRSLRLYVHEWWKIPSENNQIGKQP